MGSSWAKGWNITQTIFIYLYPLFWELTYRSDRSMDCHVWWLKRRGLTQGCAFWGIVHIAPHLGGQITPNPNLGGMNRHFPAIRAKYWSFHIFETTTLIVTKFCLRTTRWMPPDYWQRDNSNGLVIVIRNYHWLNSASQVLISTCSAPLVQTAERKQISLFDLDLWPWPTIPG